MTVDLKSRTYAEVAVGEQLPPLAIPLTRTLIVSTALATRDFQDVHHDPQLAADKGSPDIFMNILTSNGLVGRYITDWAGPETELRKVAIRLGAPNYPGDTMTLTGTVTAKTIAEDGSPLVEIAVVGANKLGNHVTGTITVKLPEGAEA
jgi:3-oxo-4,17-pregnadiene-20-carboxyl-CoA hydratase beta subunit